MKRNLFLLTLLCVTELMVATPVTPEAAKAIASQQLSPRTSRHLASAHNATPVLALAAVAPGESVADYYVFNNANQKGYVVVAGDDRAPAVLAYSDVGAFDPDNIPDGMRYMLDLYASQVAALRHSPALTVTATSQRDREVKPLVQCAWNQERPYNNLCPTFVNAKGVAQRSATGCVATATAQVMFYHKWPKQGTGSMTYECDVNKTSKQTLSVDFGSTTYRWDDMLNSYGGEYTAQQAEAVATLMYHIGVASKIDYGSSSNVSPYDMMNALIRNFGYSKAMKISYRTAMTAAEWETLIDGEIDAKRPVIFTGYSSSDGHTFVIDGYDRDGYYHVNWGWGASSNGYFLLTWLNPENHGAGPFEKGFNLTQSVITGICPDNGAPAPKKSFGVYLDSWSPTQDHVALDSPVLITVNGLSFSGSGIANPVQVSFSLLLTDLEGNPAEQFADEGLFGSTYYMGSSYTYDASDGVYYTPQSSLADGDYYLWLVYKCPAAGVNEYVPYNCSSNDVAYLNAKVQDGIMYFYKEAAASSLQVTKMDFPARVGTSSSISLAATVHNTGKEYCGNIHYLITPADQPQVTKCSVEQMIALPEGKDAVSRMNIVTPDTPGDYSLWVMDDNNKVIGGAYALQVVASANYFIVITKQISIPNYYMSSGEVTATAELFNAGSGAFFGNVPYMISNMSDGTIEETALTDIVEIPAGATVKVNIVSKFEGTPGPVYQIALRQIGAADSDYATWGEEVAFEIKAQADTGVDDISAEPIGVSINGRTVTVSGARDVAVYNLAGAVLGKGPVHTLPAGVYIIVADGTARKIAVR